MERKNDRHQLATVMKELEEEGFNWERFREYFPFGDLSMSEGEYDKLVSLVLSKLETLQEKDLLLDLLDAQWCVFLEQLWVQNEQIGGYEPPFEGLAHFASVRLEINSGFRGPEQRNRNARRMMLNLGATETLLGRMLRETEPHP